MRRSIEPREVRVDGISNLGADRLLPTTIEQRTNCLGIFNVVASIDKGLESAVGQPVVGADAFGMQV